MSIYSTNICRSNTDLYYHHSTVYHIYINAIIRKCNPLWIFITEEYNIYLKKFGIKYRYSDTELLSKYIDHINSNKCVNNIEPQISEIQENNRIHTADIINVITIDDIKTKREYPQQIYIER